MKNYKFIISGKVQGVYYRVTVKNNALKYKGYVKNLSDGNVEAGITCDEKQLKDFIKILNNGSKESSVANIQQFEISEVFTNNFEVR